MLLISGKPDYEVTGGDCSPTVGSIETQGSNFTSDKCAMVRLSNYLIFDKIET